MRQRHKILFLAALVGALLATAQAFEPAINYALHCMGCHTPDGSAVPGRVPSIRTTLLAFAGMPAGRQFLVQVPGSAQSALSNAELAELLNWMIQNLSSEPGRNDYTRFTEKEVADYRTRVVVDVRATRERLLAAIQP
jgi:cytochrome c551/c552